MAGIFIYGLVNGIIFTLMSIGFSLTFGISGIANFAYGAFYITGAYACWHLMNSLGLAYPLAIAISVLSVGFFGTIIYRFVLFRVKGIPLAEIIATLGIGIVMLELYRNMGLTGYNYKLPAFLEGSMEIFGVYIDYQRIIILGIGIVLLIFLWLFIHHTRIGLSFRGIAQDEETALSFGIESEGTAMISFGLGSSLAAFAAVIIMPLSLILVDEGMNILIIVLAVGIVGGMESTVGIVVASLIFGFSQVIVSTYASPTYSTVVMLGLIILVLVVRPSGLFGKSRELEERV